MTRRARAAAQALGWAVAAVAVGGAGAGAPRALRAQSGSVVGTARAPAAGIGSVVVYLVPLDRKRLPSPPSSAVVDQRDLRFSPRVVAVAPGSTVSFPNSDPVLHNVFHPSLRAAGFDLGTYAPGEERSFTFEHEGAYVILCRVHPEMVAYVVVIGSPYRAVTGENGRFRITGVAPGAYRLRTWHRRLASRDQPVSVAADGVTRVDMTLRLGFPVEPVARAP